MDYSIRPVPLMVDDLIDISSELTGKLEIFLYNVKRIQWGNMFDDEMDLQDRKIKYMYYLSKLDETIDIIDKLHDDFREIREESI